MDPETVCTCWWSLWESLSNHQTQKMEEACSMEPVDAGGEWFRVRYKMALG